MKKIIFAFLAAGAVCAVLGVIFGKKYYQKIYINQFDDDDDDIEPIDDHPDINLNAMEVTEGEIITDPDAAEEIAEA